MDKYEYRVKTEQLLEYTEKKQFRKAMEIADTIDWRRVKSASMLNTVSEVYENCGEFQKSRDILFMAFDRSPGSRKVVYRLATLALKVNDPEEASDCYEEFVKLAPKDPNQYILKYRILKVQKAPLEEQIAALEEFKKAEYIEKWAYELAKLYHEAGMVRECIEECDDLILWFSEGKYVYLAMELKMKYKPLTPLQQEKYDKHTGKKTKDLVLPGQDDEEDLSIPEPEKEEEEKRAPVKEKEETAAEEKEETKDTSEEASEEEEAVKAPEEVKSKPRAPITRIVTGATLEEALASGVAMAAGLNKEEKAMADRDEELKADGQMKIEDILQEWEEKQKLNADAIEKQKAEDKERLKKERKEAEKRKEAARKAAEETARKAEEEARKRAAEEAAKKAEEEAKKKAAEEAAKKAKEEAAKKAAEEAAKKAEEEAKKAEAAKKKAKGESGDASKAKKPKKNILEEKTQRLPDDIMELVEQLESRVSGTPASQKEETAKDVPEQEDILASLAEDFGEEEPADISLDDGLQADVFEDNDFVEADSEDEEFEEDETEEDFEGEEFEEDETEEDFEGEEFEEDETEEDFEDEEFEEDETEEGFEGEEFEEDEAEEDFEEDYVEDEFDDEEDFEEEFEEDELDTDESEEEFEEDDDEEDFEEEEFEDGQAGEEFDEEESEEEEFDEDEFDEEESEEEEFDEDEFDEEEFEEDDFIEDEDYEDEFDEDDFEEEEFEEDELDTDESEEEFEEDDDEEGFEEEEFDEEDFEEEELKEEIPLEIEEPSEEEIQKRFKKAKGGGGVPFDTGFVVTGRYDLSATSEIGLKAGLTEEQKKLFSYFVPVRGMSEQIVEALDNDRRAQREGTSKTGNLLVIGRKGSGKTVLAVDIVKAIQKQRNLKQGKVAIVTGESLNKKELPNIIQKLKGGAIIVEKAGKLNSRTVKELNHLMERKTGEMLFVLEDQRKPLEKVLTANPEFKKKFTSKLELPIFINDELVTFGQTYAKENGYKLDEMGILALYSRIDVMQREDHAVSVAEVKEIMDEAISHSQRVNVKHLARRVFGKGTDDSDRIILKEEDFKI